MISLLYGDFQVERRMIGETGQIKIQHLEEDIEVEDHVAIEYSLWFKGGHG